MAVKNLESTVSLVRNFVADKRFDNKRIADELLKLPATDDKIKLRIQQARQAGVGDDRIVQDLAKIPTTSKAKREEEAQVGGALGKVGRFFGSEKLGRRLGAGLASLGGGQKESLEKLKQLESEGRIEAGTAEDIRTGGVSLKQAGASALQSGASLALPFAGKALSPAVVGLKQAAIRSAGIGAFFGATGSFTRDEDVQDAVTAAAMGAVIGAALPVAGAGLSKAGKFVKGTPRRLFNTVFKASSDDLRRELESEARGVAKETLSEFALRKGFKGGIEGMAKEAITLRDDIERKIVGIASGSKDKLTINRKAYIKLLEVLGKSQKDVPTAFLPSRTQLNSLTSQLKKTKGNKISQELGLTLRRFLDNQRSTSAFRLDPNLSLKQEAFKKAADTLRTGIRNVNKGLGDKLATEGKYIQMIDTLVKEAVRTRNQKLLNLTDILLGGGGLASGFPGSGIGAAGLIRGFQAPAIQTRLGLGIQRGLVQPAQAVQQQLTKQLPGQLGTAGGLATGATRQLGAGAIGQLSKER